MVGSTRRRHSFDQPQIDRIPVKVAVRSLECRHNAQHHGSQNNDKGDRNGQAANQRFKATISRGVYNFILTDVGEGVGLVKVDKISGKEVGKIVLNDKEPVYDSDPENGMIFYKPSKKEVYGYTF